MGRCSLFFYIKVISKGKRELCVVVERMDRVLKWVCVFILLFMYNVALLHPYDYSLCIFQLNQTFQKWNYTVFVVNIR